MRHRNQKRSLQSGLIKTNEMIAKERVHEADEQRPITGSMSPSSEIELESAQSAAAADKDGVHYDTAPNYNYQQQLSTQQYQQMQQMAAMQQYQRTTNFQNPYYIAAYQALQFAPPVNHNGDNWKNLNAANPQQRMMQLMKQQQYVQQMANQAAIAMAYYLEQQQKMGNAPPNNIDAAGREHVASASSVGDIPPPPPAVNDTVGSIKIAGNAQTQSPAQYAQSSAVPPPPLKQNTLNDELLANDLPSSVANGGVLNRGGEATFYHEQQPAAQLQEEEYKEDQYDDETPDGSEEDADVHGVYVGQVSPGGPVAVPLNQIEAEHQQILSSNSGMAPPPPGSNRQQYLKKNFSELPQNMPELPFQDDDEEYEYYEDEY